MESACWPIRCVRSSACRRYPGFHWSSVNTTWADMVKFKPVPAARMLRMATFLDGSSRKAVTRSCRMVCGVFPSMRIKPDFDWIHADWIPSNIFWWWPKIMILWSISFRNFFKYSSILFTFTSHVSRNNCEMSCWRSNVNLRLSSLTGLKQWICLLMSCNSSNVTCKRSKSRGAHSIFNSSRRFVGSSGKTFFFKRRIIK